MLIQEDKGINNTLKEKPMYYLMIKEHNKTGLKYLCKSEREDHEKYYGSGTYWRKHLKQHGYDITSKVIFNSNNIEEFSNKCVHYSIEYDIIDSNEWANLIIETGLDGTLGYKHTEESKKLISEAAKGKSYSLSDETKLKISNSLKGKPMQCSPKGKRKSKEHIENMSKAKKGKPVNFTNEGLIRMKASVSLRQSIRYRCSVCGGTGNSGAIGRYHKQCMENETWTKSIVNELQ